MINKTVKSLNLILLIIVWMMFVTGGTYAYFAFSESNSIIGGNAGIVNLTLTVTKILPETNTTDNILLANFSELPELLNDKCTDGEYALCQLYKINLVNSTTGLNTNVKGSLSFNNTNTPNLSWIYLGNSYSSTTEYTSTTLPSTFNTASSTYTNFIDSYLLTAGNNIDFYILTWINETDDIQTDQGSYSGTVRFEDSNGKGITSTFTS